MPAPTCRACRGSGACAVGVPRVDRGVDGAMEHPTWPQGTLPGGALRSGRSRRPYPASSRSILTGSRTTPGRRRWRTTTGTPASCPSSTPRFRSWPRRMSSSTWPTRSALAERFRVTRPGGDPLHGGLPTGEGPSIPPLSGTRPWGHMLEDYRNRVTQSDGTHIDDFAYWGVDWSVFSPSTPSGRGEGGPRPAGRDLPRQCPGRPRDQPSYFHTFERASIVFVPNRHRQPRGGVGRAVSRSSRWPSRFPMLEPDRHPLCPFAAGVRKALGARWRALRLRKGPAGRGARKP